jgi:hypothetical protein
MSTAGTPSRRRTAALLVRLLIPGLLVMRPIESLAATTTDSLDDGRARNFDGLLLPVVLLLLAAILCQRVWHDMRVARQERKSPPVSSPTMQALLRTKAWVAHALSTKGTARMLIQIWAPPPVRHASTPAAVAPVTPQDGAHSSDSSSTTFEKLLAMKRRQNEHS